MSRQKLKILKKIKGVDNYSKNPIIDNIIRQKLQSEILVVKDNFNQLLYRQDDRRRKQSMSQQNLLIRKPRLLTPKLTTITSDKIRQSVNFTPIVDKQVINFVIERQRSSPLLNEEQVEEINRVRTNNNDFYVKLKMKDKHHYEQEINQWGQQSKVNLENKVKKMIPNDLWLPSQPVVEEIIQQRLQKDSENGSSKLQSSYFKLYLTERPASSGQMFTPLKGSRVKVNPSMQSLINQITYEPKKYHKDDYSALQKWLQHAIQFINSSKQEDSSDSDVDNVRFHLNSIYAVYMCSLKEVIRLTYIESTQKGLLIEKIVWSLLRLFQQIIEQQHKINYQEFKTSGKELKELQSYYETRIGYLETKLAATESQIINFQSIKSSIVLSCLSYKRVNHQMSNQINNMLHQIQKIQKQSEFLMSNLLKLVKDFHERGVIKIKKTQDYNEYFYLNSNNNAQFVAKVPHEDLLQKYFQQQSKNASRKITLEMMKENNQKQSGVQKLNSQLTSYWERKQNFFEINRIIKENFTTGIDDYGCQVDSRGPNPYYDQQTQFPQQKQDSFQQFLKKQLNMEREDWTKREVEYQSVNISLKELYQQAYETIGILNTQNANQKHIIQQRNQQIIFLNRKQEQLQEKVKFLNKKTNILQKEIQESLVNEEKLKTEIEKNISRIGEQKKKYLYENQNNKILVANNFGLKEKIDHANKALQNLQERIRILAPYFEKMMAIAESTQNDVLLELTSMIDKHLNEYVAHDARIFLTR